MSSVSSYMIITQYDKICLEKIRIKFEEMTERPVKFEEIKINNAGSKGCQFGDIYCFAGNYFDDDEFQNWLHNQNFDSYDIQVFFCGEQDERMVEII